MAKLSGHDCGDLPMLCVWLLQGLLPNPDTQAEPVKLGRAAGKCAPMKCLGLEHGLRVEF